MVMTARTNPFLPNDTKRPAGDSSAIMNIIGDGNNDSYGKVRLVERGLSKFRRECDRLLEVGEAVRLEVGEVLLERQRVLYLAALRAAHSLIDLAGEDAEVDEEAVARYEDQPKAREYAGCEDYNLDRLEMTVRSSLAYSEDFYVSLRTDGECESVLVLLVAEPFLELTPRTVVSEQILDRVATAVNPSGGVFKMILREETVVLTLNAFARRSIWKECLAVISQLRQYDPRCGASASTRLPQAYIGKIGLLAKLVGGERSKLAAPASHRVLT